MELRKRFQSCAGTRSEAYSPPSQGVRNPTSSSTSPLVFLHHRKLLPFPLPPKASAEAAGETKAGASPSTVGARIPRSQHQEVGRALPVLPVLTLEASAAFQGNQGTEKGLDCFNPCWPSSHPPCAHKAGSSDRDNTRSSPGNLGLPKEFAHRSVSFASLINPPHVPPFPSPCMENRDGSLGG